MKLKYLVFTITIITWIIKCGAKTDVGIIEDSNDIIEEDIIEEDIND